MEQRNWSSASYTQTRQEGEKIEQLMRSILRMFATGNLVYRDRTCHASSVETKSDRLRRLRRDSTPLTEGAAIA